MIIRRYLPSDCELLADLFYDTVHSVNRKDYSEEQLAAWASGIVDLAAWNQSFLQHDTLVAEQDGQIVGFGDMDETGYLDRLYVHKDYQHQKIATKICEALEASVKTEKVITHASITARPFFEKRGYQVIKEQQVERRGVLLTNYVMELPLPLFPGSNCSQNKKERLSEREPNGTLGLEISADIGG